MILSFIIEETSRLFELSGFFRIYLLQKSVCYASGDYTEVELVSGADV